MILEKKTIIVRKTQYSHDNAMILEKKTIIVRKIQYWKNLPMIHKKMHCAKIRHVKM